MTILVPVKRVLDPYAKVKPLADGSGLDVATVKYEINPFDEIAMEEAVRHKERNPDTRIVAVSIGTAAVEEQLRKALAIGADEAIHIETEDALDSRVVAHELAALADEMKPDLILMGKQATDEDNNQAGQRLAAKLGWPQATFASKVEIQGDQLTVTRETDAGEETLQMALPAVVTTDLRLNEPRYIALPGIIKARSKPLSKRGRMTDTQPFIKTTSVASPPARSAGRKVASAQELAAAVKASGVLG
ncbi:MAG: electron transfer flavoprotein subunit beta/FixA family protein [Fimbriimonadaceae bacterium]|nr:electron transfer flavoprotein subunit beta/FixA family protein [Fimbriimonadaceae bacterium]